MTFRIDEEDNLRYEGRDGVDHMVYKHPLLTKLVGKKIVNAFLNQHDEAVIILEDGTEISTDCDDVLSIDGEWYWHWMTEK